MTAAEKIVKFGEFNRDHKPDATPVETDIYTGLISALKLIKQHANGSQVEVSIETHNVMEGVWKKRLIAQQIEFNVKITVNEETE